MQPLSFCMITTGRLPPCSDPLLSPRSARNTSDGGMLSAPWASHPPEDLSGLPSLLDPGSTRGCDWTEVPLCLHVSSPCRKRSGISGTSYFSLFLFFSEFISSFNLFLRRGEVTAYGSFGWPVGPYRDVSDGCIFNFQRSLLPAGHTVCLIKSYFSIRPPSRDSQSSSVGGLRLIP